MEFIIISNSTKHSIVILRYTSISKFASIESYEPKIKTKEKLEDMSNEEFYKLQDGFIALRCHATKGLENIARIMHNRFENQKTL